MQQNTTRVLIASLFFFFLAFTLSAYSAKNPAISQTGSRAVLEILAPVQRLYWRIDLGLRGVWEGYINLINTNKENARLRERLAALEATNSHLLEYEHENRRLRKLVELRANTGLNGMVANVIGRSPSNWTSSILVDKGIAHGVDVGMAVAEGDGVVGQVISVASNTSRVLLLTDHSSGIDAIIQGSRTRGVVEGTGAAKAQWSYVVSEDHVAIGDRVITSGMDGVFPKGLLIGVIFDIGEVQGGKLFRDILIEPSVDLSRLETVLILKADSSNSEPIKVEQPKDARGH